MELTTPRAIIFDWDNTLVDTWPVIHEALNATFTRMGVEPWSMEQVKARVAHSMRNSFPAIFGARWTEAADIYQACFKAIHLQRLRQLAGAGEMLEWLAAKPVYLAVVSNKRGGNLRIEADHIGWSRFFGKIVGADDTPRDKPAADPVHAALEGAPVAAGKDVWLIGDSAIDMECAHTSGCVPVFYGELPATPMSYGFAAHVRNHPELVDLLSRML